MRELRVFRGTTREPTKEETLTLAKIASEELAEEELYRGALTKPKSPVEKLDARMEKVEQRTDFLIEKSKKQKNKPMARTSLELGSYTPRITIANHASFSINPSKIDYLYLMGNPLTVINYIIHNLNESGFLDTSTDEIAGDLELKEHTVKNVISKLTTRGFLNCRSITGNKRRIFVVNPSIINL